MEKGLLMVILSFIFCKGEPRSDGSRWLLDKELYRLLHTVDENIHAEPPVASGGATSKRLPSSAATSGTPDVDAVIEKCVNMDYLIKVKASVGGEAFLAMSQEVEETSHFYAIGPRAALEIGRSQIVHFCASILDQEPDPNMLAEIEQAEQEEEEEE
jgi:MAGE family